VSEPEARSVDLVQVLDQTRVQRNEALDRVALLEVVVTDLTIERDELRRKFEVAASLPGPRP
jgi:type IV secretory pathway component VirB8